LLLLWEFSARPVGAVISQDDPWSRNLPQSRATVEDHEKARLSPGLFAKLSCS